MEGLGQVCPSSHEDSMLLLCVQIKIQHEKLGWSNYNISNQIADYRLVSWFSVEFCTSSQTASEITRNKLIVA